MSTVTTTLRNAAVLAFCICAVGVDGATAEGAAVAHADYGGAVYAMTDASSGNQILVFFRDRSGRLDAVPRATISTGGLGGSVSSAVDPLGSQNSLVYDAGLDMLFAVNAGDNTVAEIDPGPFGLSPRLRSVVPSGGYIPVSLAVSDQLLYVLNAGGTGSVTTFAIGNAGQLSQVGTFELGLPPVETAPPFNRVPAPGQVGVDRLARRLIVTHAGGQELLVAALDDAGVPTGPLVSTPTPGAGTFSFDVTRYGTILVAEAAAGAVSAFDPPAGTGPLIATASSVGTGQAATCWLIVQQAGFAYVSNTGSDTLSQYRYTRTGGLQLVNAVAAHAAGAPTDLALANAGGFLYSLNAASGAITGFAIDSASGALTPVETQGGLPAGAGIQGIAARDF